MKCLLFVSLIAVCLAANPLGSYNVNINTTSVGGLSSGGYFAVQMQVAYSSFITGAAIFAGGPYDCAEGSENTALTTCTEALPLAPQPSKYVSTTKTRASEGLIDPVANLAKHKVYMYSGTEDTTVKPAVMQALYTYYTNFISASNINFEKNIKSAHTQPTIDPTENSCTVSKSPYISYCNYDGAGIGLNQIYGALNGRNNGTLSGQLLTFDQSAFHANPTSISLATTGYVYVPAACAAGQPCRLHVSFHGCLQYAGTVGTQYVEHAGYNQWADSNNIIVLYPQTTTELISNPDGCWDWWGYVTGDKTNYDTNKGQQMTTIRAMIAQITKGYVA